LDSLAFSNANLQANKPTLILYFNSECDHCQYEAEAISQNVNKFENVNLLWVSYESLSIIRQFANTYKLASYPNIHFTKINHKAILSTFGSVSIPHIFIYDKDDKLLKEYKGETKVEALLKYL
jgi:thiol-disulfide isomerase/thioredoxin